MNMDSATFKRYYTAIINRIIDIINNYNFSKINGDIDLRKICQDLNINNKNCPILNVKEIYNILKVNEKAYPNINVNEIING